MGKLYLSYSDSTVMYAGIYVCYVCMIEPISTGIVFIILIIVELHVV